MKKFGHLTILVDDYDEALDFYTKKLGFVIKSDNKFGDNNRWLTVAPSAKTDLEIVFVKANTDEKRKIVGKQAANHVFLTLQTDDCWRDFKIMQEKGVHFFGEPTEQFYGTEVVFEDLYGNRFDLIQVADGPHTE
jgi:catechol 2,3-dioxygenase-like lactoylglutathione lyase family enzyme